MIAAFAVPVVLVTLAAGPLFVDPHSVVPDADGTRARPFRTIAAALAAATDGATVELGTGLYTERVVVAKKVTLRGGKAAVIASPDATGTVVELQAPARLEHLAIQGGEVGVRATDGSSLRDVDFSAQRRAGVVVAGKVEIVGGRFAALFDRQELVGIDAEKGARVEVAGAKIDGPFRWAIRGRGAEVIARGVDIEGAVGSVALEAKSRGVISGSVMAQGRQVGIRVDDSIAKIADTLVSRFDRCIDAAEGGTVEVTDSAIGFCEEAGITAAGGSKVTLGQVVYVGKARLAAIAAIDSQLRINEGLVLDPGATGIALHRAKGEINGTLVRGATGKAEGDAIYSEDSQLEIRGAFAEESAGNGVTLVEGKARLAGFEVFRAQGSGIRVENGAEATTEGTWVQNAAAGLSVTGGGKVQPRFDRYLGTPIQR